MQHKKRGGGGSWGRKRERGKESRSDIVCARGLLWVCGSVRGGRRRRGGIITSAAHGCFAWDWASGAALGHKFSRRSEQMSEQTWRPLLCSCTLNIPNSLFFFCTFTDTKYFKCDSWKFKSRWTLTRDSTCWRLGWRRVLHSLSCLRFSLIDLIFKQRLSGGESLPLCSNGLIFICRGGGTSLGRQAEKLFLCCFVLFWSSGESSERVSGKKEVRPAVAEADAFVGRWVRNSEFRCCVFMNYGQHSATH